MVVNILLAIKDSLTTFYFYRYHAIAHLDRLQYNINLTFIGTGKPKKNCVTHLIVIFALS